MCKHVAAVLYGIGARLDRQPELLFRLRGVDEMELLASAGKGAPLGKLAPAAGKRLGGEDLSAMFGLDMAQGAGAEAGEAGKKPAKKQPAAKKAVAKVTAKKKAAAKKKATAGVRALKK
jgi:uncharacterized Zn finger protein